MREMLFRGQHRKFGQKVRMGDGKPLPSVWAFGEVMQGPGDYSIIYGTAIQDPSDSTIIGGIREKGSTTEKWVVYTETLGQYVGFPDKSGKKIFEGDIVRVKTQHQFFAYAVVVWYTTYARWCFSPKKDIYYPLDDECDVEVIGNIFDNPELMQKFSVGSEF